MNVIQHLEKKFTKALQALNLPKEFPVSLNTANKHFAGDYQCNIAMKAGKLLNVSPLELAHDIANHVKQEDTENMLAAIQVTPPGFINIHINDNWINTQLIQLWKTPQEYIASKKKQIVVVDYSAPNVAKEMHVGHLRSTIIGDAMVRTLTYLGHTVIRQNHLGDWGTQFGMLIAYLELLEHETHDNLRFKLANLEEFYKNAKQTYDKDEAFAKKARNYVVKLQRGDQYCFSLWKKLVQLTLEHIETIYQRLDITLKPSDIFGESAYNEQLPNIINQLQEKKLLLEENNTKLIKLDEFKNKQGQPMGVIVQKSDGGFLYTTTDLAAIHYRCNQLQAKRIIYYVDARQSQHLEQIFTIAKKAELCSAEVKLEHHAFGMMLGEDGTPFKTRSGATIKLNDFLDEAEERTARFISSRNTELDEQEKFDLIKKMTVGAIKYADLSKNRTSNYLFNWDHMLSLTGNTAPYLMYAYTRIKSLFRKSVTKLDDTQAFSDTTLDLSQTSVERDLALQLIKITETLQLVEERGTPHLLCNYLYELASLFMKFYESCPINQESINTSLKQSRLFLCAITADIIKLGLSLLGISTVEKM